MNQSNPSTSDEMLTDWATPATARPLLIGVLL